MDLTPRQIEILHAATTLIGDKGMKNLTMKRLAHVMGFSEPALYRHFKNKEEILRFLLLYYMGELNRSMRLRFTGDATGLDRLRALVSFQFEYFQRYPALVLVIFSETSLRHNEVLSVTVLELLQNKRKLIESMLCAGQTDGSIRKDLPETQLAVIIMGSLRLTILHWRLSDFKDDLTRLGEELWKTLYTLLTSQNESFHQMPQVQTS